MNWLFPSGLRKQVVVLFLGLLLGVQVMSYSFLTRFNQGIAQAEIGRQLDNAERLFKNQLTQMRVQLERTASVLVGDFPFKSAIATLDLQTAASVLTNHGGRINADLMMVVSLDGEVLVDTSGATAKQAIRFPELTVSALERGSAYDIVYLNEHAYQLVLLPVMAPRAVALVAVGFRIEDTLARELKDMQGIEVSFAHLNKKDSSMKLLGSSLSKELHPQWISNFSGALSASIGSEKPPAEIPVIALGSEEFESRIIKLSEDKEGVLAVTLQQSRSATLAAFSTLGTTFALITLAGLGLFAMGSFLLAKRIVKPMQTLGAAAARIEGGDYTTPVAVNASDEINSLSASLDNMRGAIASRESRITEMAYQDRLTGLPNRALFNDRLEQAIKVAKRGKTKMSVMVMDLNDFKYVNDSLGHPAGDEVLIEIARRVRTLLRDSDTVARLGGDEFAVMIEGNEPQAAIALADKIAHCIMDQAILVNGEALQATASIGVASYPVHALDGPALVQAADVAMYEAKRTRAGIAEYDPAHGEQAQSHLRMLGDLRRAVENKQFSLVYQPKVSLDPDGQVHGVEALLRWKHPELGNVPPDKFIPFAEKTGYITTITREVLRIAADQAAKWREKGLAVNISVNISTQDLWRANLPLVIGELLLKHQLPLDAISLEITESNVMEEPNASLQSLTKLRDMGIQLSIDDYGKGYSSLSYIQKLPVHELKVDGDFVMTMDTNPENAVIVQSTIDLGHKFGLTVVAEGVESEIQRSMLKQMGCDVVQGYWLSRPLAPENVEAWIRDSNRQAKTDSSDHPRTANPAAIPA
jgi:diguanylate cyclase (GGDEF)-like protein